MKNKIKIALWRWTLKRLRFALDAADEWLHAQEVQFRESVVTSHESPVTDLSVDRKASAARERAIKKTRTPRLRYQGGQFVREGVSNL